jgi:4-hydroxybenzoate-CoA ligase
MIMSEQNQSSAVADGNGTFAADIPRNYNTAVDFIERNLAAGRGAKIAVIDDAGSYTYDQIGERVNQAANALQSLGVVAEQRVLLALLDSVDFIAVFFGAMKLGAVPVPLNTLLTSADYDFMLADSRASALVVSTALWDKFENIVDDKPRLAHVIHSAAGGPAVSNGLDLTQLLAAAAPAFDAVATTKDDPAFWLYSSGSTGRPKGVVHLHADMAATAVHYGISVLGIRESDVVFSAAKLFFAYGLGNGLTFPMYVGATAVLMAERPTPAAVMQRLKDHQVDIFYGVPTLFGGILADASITKEASSDKCRICVSAGEALPEDIALRWKERFGTDIIDGIGSTEMLHIFLSNQPGDIKLGTTGRAVPGYDLKIIDENGDEAGAGELGELVVNGPSSGALYWNNREKSLATFQGAWTRTGDKYICDADGYFVYAGRSDDMLKVGGIWVSPFEVESALMSHPAVLEAAVVGQRDKDDLVKPKAFIVLQESDNPDDGLARTLQQHVKNMLAPYKYPRWIEFAEELPKTATGKIQRFKLRS